MNVPFRQWFGQITTAHGAMVLGPTLLAIASGSMSWQAALPLLAGGTIGLLWPENKPLAGATQTAVADISAVAAAWRTRPGIPTPEAPKEAASTSSAPKAMALAALVVGSTALTGCAGQTQAQRTADASAFVSGLICIADTSGKVIQAATTADPDTVKAANAAEAAGGMLVTDAACQAALAMGTVAPPPAMASASQP
ncbi:MAG TPA: hypothetical protein VIG49_09050 [Acetobacteraceae bacterium]